MYYASNVLKINGLKQVLEAKIPIFGEANIPKIREALALKSLIFHFFQRLTRLLSVRNFVISFFNYKKK